MTATLTELLDAIELDATVDAPGHAREVVAAASRDLPDDVRDDALVVVSELVGNSVRHAAGPVTLTVRRTAGALRIEVGDRGTGHVPSRVTPPPARSAHGRGLLLVEALAAAWGTTHAPRGGGKTVWCELAV